MLHAPLQSTIRNPKWEGIYQPTVFFVGKTDDLNVYDYAGLIKEIYGIEPAELSLNDVADETKLTTFIEEAQKLRNPLINSSWIWEWGEAQEVTKGFRFMGQRFIPDSYMFTQLVHNKVKDRYFPKALDVLAVLGLERAYQILDKRYEKTKYANYIEQMEKLKTQFSDLEDTVWAHKTSTGTGSTA